MGPSSKSKDSTEKASEMIRKLWNWGFMDNCWAWFHILFGGLGARLFMCVLDAVPTIALVFLITILWEVVEYFADGGAEGMIDIYGSLERWAYDSAGDIIGANLMALAVVL